MFFWSNITEFKTLHEQEINKYANQFVEMSQLKDEIERMSLIKKTVEQQNKFLELIKEEKKEEQKAKIESEAQANAQQDFEEDCENDFLKGMLDREFNDKKKTEETNEKL